MASGSRHNGEAVHPAAACRMALYAPADGFHLAFGNTMSLPDLTWRLPLIRRTGTSHTCRARASVDQDHKQRQPTTPCSPEANLSEAIPASL